jgi:crossover junction endodeoxyribonuclease RusA
MYYGKTRRLTSKALKWFAISREICTNEVKLQDWKIDNKHVWYYVDMEFYFADRRIRDSHNTLKILMDALQGTIFNNDYYCMTRINKVCYDKNNPRVEIKIYPVDYSKW